MSERSRSPPPMKAAEEPSQATVQSVQDTVNKQHDTIIKQFEMMKKKFEQLDGNQIAMSNGMGVMGTRINDMEANLKF